MIKIGMMIGNRYEILEKIGTGGTSDVYKAKCHKLNRFVAIKILKQEFSENASFVQKFRVEAQAAAGLMHANIVNVYDVGEENGIYYIVMELVEGITLKNYIEKKSRLSVKEAVSIAIQVSLGIEAAHNNKIIHRDIKPQNIIISKEGRVKVTDFGIAKAATSNTITSNVMGSVHYTSPEQARGGYSDAKSDIYSLGITLFEMLTGRVPFNGETTVSIAIKHIQDEMPSPRQFVSDIPVSVEKIVLKCCQKVPDKRYRTVAELIEDLKKSLVNPNEDFVQMAPARAASTRTTTTRANAGTGARTVAGAAAGAAAGTAARANAGTAPVRTTAGSTGTRANSNPAARTNAPVRQAEEEVRTAVPRGRETAHTADAEEKFYGTRTWDAKDVNSVAGENGASEYSAEYLEQRERRIRQEHAIRENREADEYKDTPKKRSPESAKKKKTDDYDEKMERITTTIMVLAVIIIGLVVLYVVARVLGFFDTESTQPENPSGIEQTVTPSVTDPDTEPDDDTDNVAGTIAVPAVTGLLRNVARVNLTEQGFEVTVEEVESAEVAEGYVISQNPEAGSRVAIGSTITIQVSTGAEIKYTTIPTLLGLTEDQAVTAIQGANLKVGSIEYAYNENYIQGLVCSYGYPSDQVITLPEGTELHIVISLGPEEATYSYNLYVTAPNDSDYQGGAAEVILVGSNGEILYESGSPIEFPVSATIYPIQNVSRGTIYLNYTVTVTSQTPEGQVVINETRTITTEVAFVKEIE